MLLCQSNRVTLPGPCPGRPGSGYTTESASTTTTSAATLGRVNAESTTAPGPNAGWSLKQVKNVLKLGHANSTASMSRSISSCVYVLLPFLVFLLAGYVHLLPFLHNRVYFVADHLLRVLLSLVKLLSHIYVQAGSRNSLLHPCRHFPVVLLQNICPNVNILPLSLRIPLRLQSLAAIARLFVC